MLIKGSQKTRLLIAAGIAIVIALALGLGLGFELKDSSSTAETESYKLASNVQLDGLTSALFTDEPKLAFRTGMATTLDVKVSAITITSVEDVAARRRRSLLAAGLKVNFEVEIVPAVGDTTDTTIDVVDAVATRLTSTPLATITTNLQTAFDAVVTSNTIVIVVTAAPPAPEVNIIFVGNNNVTTTAPVCGTNERVSGGTCVACPTGQSNKLGDNPSGPDTLCDTTAPLPPPPSPPPPSPSPPPPSPPPGEYCSANQYVSGGRCEDCASGTRRSAGDSASGDDTTCSTVTCGVNQYVNVHACTSCPTGYINDAGTETSCLKCAANYRVLDGACVACASGDTNDAGDVIASGNSSCDSEGDTAGDTVGDD